MSNGRTLLTTADVAERWNVTTMTVRRWVKAGHLPATRLPGGRLRFDPTDVEALAATVEPDGSEAA